MRLARIAIALGFVFLLAGLAVMPFLRVGPGVTPAYAAGIIVTNPSFESGLTGWSVGPSDNGGSNAGNCGFNGATAPGTETRTGTAGFAATDGTETALGSVQETAGARYACVLYQDVDIPAGATTATLTADLGLKYVSGMSSANSAIEAGLFSTSTVPSDTFGGGGTLLISSSVIAIEPGTSDTVLGAQSAGPFDVSSVAGSTVRLAVIIFTKSTTGQAVAGIDNVSLTVNVATTTPTITATATPTSSATPTVTDTATATATDSPTDTPTDTATATPTVTDTPTNTTTNTPTETATATSTPTDTATATDTSTTTPSLTVTATSTWTPTPTVTASAMSTPIDTPTVTNTPGGPIVVTTVIASATVVVSAPAPQPGTTPLVSIVVSQPTVTPQITPAPGFVPRLLFQVDAYDGNGNSVHQLAEPITISITFRPTAGENGFLAQIYMVDMNGNVQQLQTTSVRNSDGTFTVTATTMHLFRFQVFVPSEGSMVRQAIFPMFAVEGTFATDGW